MTDPLQHPTTYEYAGGDLVKITDALGRVTQRFVDAGGRVLSQIDPAGQITRFAYDKLNHLTQGDEAVVLAFEEETDLPQGLDVAFLRQINHSWSN